MRNEDEKLAFALELAYNEISKDKSSAADDEQTIPDQSISAKKRNYLGTHTMIKLPYVIGQPEYAKHPFAGLVYTGNLADELEQVDLFKEE